MYCYNKIITISLLELRTLLMQILVQEDDWSCRYETSRSKNQEITINNTNNV